MKTLRERIIEREYIPGIEQRKEKNAWEIYWKKWGPKLFVYACSKGTVEVTTFFMEMELETGESDGSLLKKAEYEFDIANYNNYGTIMCLYSENGDTPLSAAARNGNDEVLLYLLEDCNISIPQYSKQVRCECDG